MLFLCLHDARRSQTAAALLARQAAAGHTVGVKPRPETRYAKNDEGLNIAYQVVGEGPRDIALASTPYGIDMLWDDPEFTAVATRLCRLGRMVLIDWRGFGSSDPVPLGALPTPEDWLDDLRVVLDAAGSERAYLIGSGAGGAMAALFAATYPQRAAGLVAVDAYARGIRGDDYRIGPPGPVVDSYLEWMEASWGTPDFGAFECPSRAQDEQYLYWSARARRLTQSPLTLVATLRWSSRLDIRSALSSVQVPTLVIHSRDNPVFRQDAGRYLAEHIAGARFVERRGREAFLLSRSDGSEVLDYVEEFITGERPVPEVDRAFATILFTDVVGSTSKVSEVGDHRWRQVLDRHDQVVARQIDRFRGRKVNSTGDGVLATFDGPARAVRCAQAIVDEVAALGIELRAGLHAGEVELRGQDIGGIAVHIGQRVCSLAGSGEVFVSRTITDLVAGSGLHFADRGEHELKGIPGAWRLYAVED